ncbi:MAG: cytochrome c [Planctomycetota bacterium]
MRVILGLTKLAVAAAAPVLATEPPDVPRLQKSDGFRGLREQPIVEGNIDAELFYATWRTWPDDLRAEAESLPEAERRAAVRRHYGLPASADAGDVPFAYAETRDGTWATNCFVCHAGQVAGELIPGAPNTQIDLQSLVEDVVMAKVRIGRPLAATDLGVAAIPLSRARGTTNAVVFGILFDYLRDDDMNLVAARPRTGELLHHDVDPPAWWTTKKKSKLYIDGFAPKNHRVLMQFMLAPSNSRADVLATEPLFEKVLADIEACQPPAYPGPVDETLAARGRVVFEATCAECHGTYGRGQGDPEWTYPERMIPLDEIGTDRVRHDALTVADRESLQSSWMNFYGRDDVLEDPSGYVAPPLDGVWASAPYFHNGSVPTLWHVLNPDDRPAVWARPTDPDAYDFERVGLRADESARLPGEFRSTVDRRRYYDTSEVGHSSAGHDYPLLLDEAERRAVLEYLKKL